MSLSSFAVDVVACGLVVVQVTAVVTLLQVYQSLPLETSLTLIVDPAGGAVFNVKATESMFDGVVAFNV